MSFLINTLVLLLAVVGNASANFTETQIPQLKFKSELIVSNVNYSTQPTVTVGFKPELSLNGSTVRLGVRQPTTGIVLGATDNESIDSLHRSLQSIKN